MFEQSFIDSTREAQGEEAANQLIVANAREAHSGRIDRITTDPLYAEKYPRMVAGVKNKVTQLPVLADDSAVEAYLKQQEDMLAALGVPLPGQAPPTPPAEGEKPGDPDYGQRPGLIAWSKDATQAMHMGPVAPGPAPGELSVAQSRVEDLMEVEEGQFTSGRQRDRAMLRELEGANSLQGGSGAMFEVARRHESPNVFTS